MRVRADSKRTVNFSRSVSTQTVRSGASAKSRTRLALWSLKSFRKLLVRWSFRLLSDLKFKKSQLQARTWSHLLKLLSSSKSGLLLLRRQLRELVFQFLRLEVCVMDRLQIFSWVVFSWGRNCSCRRIFSDSAITKTLLAKWMCLPQFRRLWSGVKHSIVLRSWISGTIGSLFCTTMIRLGWYYSWSMHVLRRFKLANTSSKFADCSSSVVFRTRLLPELLFMAFLTVCSLDIAQGNGFFFWSVPLRSDSSITQFLEGESSIIFSFYQMALFLTVVSSINLEIAILRCLNKLEVILNVCLRTNEMVV